MAFFRNDTVNLLNLHYAIHSLALSGGGAFFAAFLLHAGVPAPMVLLSLALIIGGRFVIRPLVLIPAVRWGLRPLVIAGTVLSGLQYPLLAQVHGVGPTLFLLCAVSGVGDAVYWTAYHAYFASLGDAEHRGHQIGAREAVAAVVGVVGPLLAGWALTTLGPTVAFDATAVVLLLAALPFIGTPNVRVAKAAPGSFKASAPGARLFVAHGWIAATLGFTWQIALFTSLGGSFTAYGGAMALAAIAGAVSGLVLGRLIDAGHGGRAVGLSAASLVLLTALEAAAAGRPVLAVAANALGALVWALYTPTLMTALYNQAKSSPCTLRFHIAAEGGWDAGAAAGCLAAAGLLWAGAPISMAILLALVGAAAVSVLLQRYYAELPPSEILIGLEPPTI